MTREQWDRLQAAVVRRGAIEIGHHAWACPLGDRWCIVGESELADDAGTAGHPMPAGWTPGDAWGEDLGIDADGQHVCDAVTTTDGHGAYCLTCGETLA